MGKTFLKFFLSLFLFLSGGYSQLSAHSPNLFDSTSTSLNGDAGFITAHHDRAPAVTPSSESDKDKRPKRSTDIEGAEEEWTPGKKYLDNGNGVPVVSKDLVPQGPVSGIISGSVNFFYSEAFSCLYLLYRLIRI